LLCQFVMTARALQHSLPAERRSRTPRWRLRIFVLGVVALLGACAILVGLAWRASNALMTAPPSHYAWSLADYPALATAAEPLTVHSRTGATLVGRFFRGRSGATVIVSHGYGGDQDEILPVANALHAAGFTVVTYNERGRDGSTGQGTWGALETQDLRSVIDTVARHRYVDPNEIAEFGFSIGADISILEAAADRRIKAVVADASWPSLSGYMKPRLSDIILDPTAQYSPLALKLLELRTGAQLDQVKPVAAIARISPRPILLIQGLADTDVTPRDGIVNFDHARAPRQLWLVKGEGHEGTISPGGAGTSPRVMTFFAHALRLSHA
jgi:cephalosporin-C deacetylase-like acetyl esterase